MQTTSSRRGALLALVAASSAANLYYAQPVLASVGRSLDTSAEMASAVVVATLIGNALAQLLLVPLSDMVERRRLARCLLCLQAAGMAATALTHSLGLAVAGSLVLGLGGAAAMVVLPYAAALSAPGDRGKVTGTVMSGVLLGILVSRSISGVISSCLSWRATYAIGGLTALVGALAMGTLPRSRAESTPRGYGTLLVSVARLVRSDRLLRQRMLVGAMGFVSFNVLWTGLTLLLSSGRHHYSDAAIGAFGLIGLVGALVARNAGAWHDRGHGQAVMLAGWGVTALAWVVSLAADHTGAIGLVAVVTTVALLDAGMQGQHVTNQATLLTARSRQSGRATTAYMSSCVLAGAAGSAVASALFPRYGWTALAVAGLTCCGTALAALRPRGPRE